MDYTLLKIYFMKKIFTFLLSTAILSSAFAQTDYTYHFSKKNYQNYNNDPRYERDKEIEEINYLNSFQVQRLVDDPCLNIWEKRDALDAQASQRIQKVNSVYQKYSNSVAYTSNKMRHNFERMYDRKNKITER